MMPKGIRFGLFLRGHGRIMRLRQFRTRESAEKYAAKYFDASEDIYIKPIF